MKWASPKSQNLIMLLGHIGWHSAYLESPSPRTKLTNIQNIAFKCNYMKEKCAFYMRNACAIRINTHFCMYSIRTQFSFFYVFCFQVFGSRGILRLLSAWLFAIFFAREGELMYAGRYYVLYMRRKRKNT